VADGGLSRRTGPTGSEEASGELDVLDTAAAGGLVLRGGLLRIIGYILGTLASVIGAALMLRHLSVADFGRYTIVLSLITIVGALTDLGLTGVGVRQSAVGSLQERERILRNLLGIRLTTSTVGILLTCSFGIAVGYPTVMVEGTAIAGLGLLMLVTLDSYTIPLQVGLRLGWTAGLDLLRQCSQTIVVVALVLAGASLLPFTGSQLPGAAAAALVAALLIRGKTRLLPAFDRAQWRRMARELLPYAAASAIGAVYFRVEIVVLSLVSGEHQTGLFSAAFRITEVVVGIPWLVAASALPVIARAAENDRERLAYALRQMFRASLVAGVGMAVAIALGAKFALDLVAGPHYEGSVGVLRIQATTVAFTFLVTQWGFALLALKQMRALLVSNALALVTAIGATVVLGRVDGARGASLALVGAEAVLAVAYAISLARVSDELRVRLGGLPRVVGAAAAAIGVAAISGTPSLPATIIGVAVYVLALAATGGLPPEVWELLPGRRTG
jgi:O-antigen/teichoic acid export membrane protein